MRFKIGFVKLVPNTKGQWKPKTFAEVEVEADSQDGAFVMAERIAQADSKLNEAHTFKVRPCAT